MFDTQSIVTCDTVLFFWTQLAYVLFFILLCSQESSFRRNRLLEQTLVFIGNIASSFNSPPSLKQSVRPALVPYHSLCNTCVTYKTLCCSIGHQVLPTKPLRKMNDIIFLPPTLFSWKVNFPEVKWDLKSSITNFVSELSHKLQNELEKEIRKGKGNL